MTELTYFEQLSQIISENRIDVLPIVNKIVEHVHQNSSIWIMGNGGSASTAEHFETDLHFVRHGKNVTSVRACAITSNSSLITAISNDIGYENVFSHQLLRKATKGDLCILISASGNSDNVIKAANLARDMGLTSIAISGFDGGALLKIADLSLLVTTPIGHYGPVEDLHLAICHEISANVLRILTHKD